MYVLCVLHPPCLLIVISRPRLPGPRLLAPFYYVVLTFAPAFPPEPPTPSSSATVRRRISSLQYLDEDDDEVHMSRARSSSRTYRWIEDQQFYPSAAEDVRAGPPHAARPQMSMPTLLKNDRYDTAPTGLNKHHGHTNHRASRARDANDAVAQVWLRVPRDSDRRLIYGSPRGASRRRQLARTRRANRRRRARPATRTGSSPRPPRSGPSTSPSPPAAHRPSSRAPTARPPPRPRPSAVTLTVPPLTVVARASPPREPLRPPLLFLLALASRSQRSPSPRQRSPLQRGSASGRLSQARLVRLARQRRTGRAARVPRRTTRHHARAHHRA